MSAYADSDEVARAFRDDVARRSEMMSPGFDASLACVFFRAGYVSVKRAQLRSVASISARRVDGEEVVDIKIDDRL